MTATPALAPDLCTHGLPAFRFTVQSDTSVDVAVPLRDVKLPLPMRDSWGEDMEWPYAGEPADVIAGFAPPCPTAFRRLDELGPEAVGQRLEPDRAVIECRAGEPRSPTGGQHCREALLQIFDETLGNLQRRKVSPDFGRPPSDDSPVPLLRPGARTLDRLTTTFTHSGRPPP